jgi:cephalosporin hydroxylase
MIRPGSYVVDRDQPALTSADAEAVDRFHHLYYRRWIEQSDTINLSWLGYQLLKCPLDLWMYQELLFRTRPDVVVETGTFQGGSALYLACILDQLGNGEVITIDTTAEPNRPLHPRIQYVLGSSIDPGVVSKTRALVAGRRTMVILDSDHTEAHVHAEMNAYSPLVHVDDYMIVEDTNVNGHPAWPEFGPGPMEAVNRFLSARQDFEIDERCERFMMTLNPRGYLRRRERQSNL